VPAFLRAFFLPAMFTLHFAIDAAMPESYSGVLVETLPRQMMIITKPIYDTSMYQNSEWPS